MPDTQPLDYDALARAYVDNLHTALRNFSQGPAFLEGWAHDDDHGRSVLGMFEAARDAGVATLAVRVGEATLATLDRAWLAAELGALGTLSAIPDARGIVFRIDFPTR